MTTYRTTGWSDRTIRFPDGRTFTGWTELDGGEHSVETTKHMPGGSSRSITLKARTVMVDDMTVKMAFDVADEMTMRRYFNKWVELSGICEIYDAAVNPKTRKITGKHTERGQLGTAKPPSGGTGDATDTAEFELTFVMDS